MRKLSIKILTIVWCLLLYSDAIAQKNLDEAMEDLSAQIGAPISKEQRLKIGMIPFSDLGGQVSLLGSFLSEELTTRLFKFGNFNIAEKALIDKVIKELKLSETGIIDPATAKRIGQLAGVDAIISGTITDFQNHVAVNCRMINIQTGLILSAGNTKIGKDEDVRKLMGQPLPQTKAEEPVLGHKEHAKVIEGDSQSQNILYLALVSLNPSYLWTSTDLVSWKETVREYKFRAFTHANRVFVGVGEDMGNASIMYSKDGVNWNKRTAERRSALNGIAYGNGKFVAVGDNGALFISNDGINWTDSSSTERLHFQKITFGDGRFVSYTLLNVYHGPGYFLTSTDGITWSKSEQINQNIFWIAHGKGKFVGVGRNGTILTSTNGLSWSKTESWVKGEDFLGITFGNDLFVAVGTRGTICTSHDGANWTPQKLSGVDDVLLGVAYVDGKFIAVGGRGTILTSSEGSNWKKMKSNLSGAIAFITHGNLK